MNQQRTRAFGHFLALLTVVAALGAVGCAGGKQASISGHVNYQGKPVTSGTVVLMRQQHVRH
jgi:anaerobic selenocysteine-containing dehydrogenase